MRPFLPLSPGFRSVYENAALGIFQAQHCQCARIFIYSAIPGRHNLIEQRRDGTPGLKGTAAKNDQAEVALWKQPQETDWFAASEAEHFVQFYDSDSFLLNSLSGFISTGLTAGESCVVVANQAHRLSLEERLHVSGLDMNGARRSGQYLALDSSETLTKIMVNGSPERGRFMDVVGGLIGRASSGGGGLRVFGDMVAQLSAAGQHQAAVDLEALWNDLRQKHSFSLYCAYPLHVFGDETHGPALADVCTQHSHVIPAESYSILPDHDARQRQIILLQQKARLLEAELKERDRRLAREQLARAEAETANRLKDQFLATVSHELRTPLNAIIGWSHMLRGGKLDPTTASRAVETIERNAKAQAQLVEDLLDVSRMITGNLRLNVMSVDVAAVINMAVDCVQLAAATKNIQLEVTLDPSARHVEGDAGRLQQVVWNLLANSIKFTPAGGRILVRLRRLAAGLQVQVSDTGAGISPDFLPFIFDRFRQADGSSTRTQGGLGLGLAIVRHLVELHGGTVKAESEGEGCGATFTIQLPLAVVSEGAAKPRRVTGSLLRDDGPREYSSAPRMLDHVRILLVDDDLDTLHVLRAKLTACQAEVETASSAAAAIEILSWFDPDVVVSDLAMPGQDGYALIDKIRAGESGNGKQLPAIALTAYVRVEDRTRALSAGFNLFVPKPVQPEELVAAIANLIELA
jgi:signal transduction histidine kinase/ActR/RegA family two-component response regulator